MKRALILYWHGLGDVILLTPHLRHLYNEGYIVDLMCRTAVRDSKLLDACPYIDKLIIVENPWQSQLGKRRQRRINMAAFEGLRHNYDWSGASPHNTLRIKRHKIDMTSAELGIGLQSKKLEVFIPPSAEEEARVYLMDEFIFVHTYSEFHAYHDWDSDEWIETNLPPMRKLYLSNGRCSRMMFRDINTAFVIAREAKHRVLSSGVLVHACEAMGVVMDAINYGRPDRKVWPLAQSMVLHIRERERWIR